MPSCRKELIIKEHKTATEDEAELILQCIDSEGHEGEHQAQVWATNLPNAATGGNGFYITIKF